MLPKVDNISFNSLPAILNALITLSVSILGLTISSNLFGNLNNTAVSTASLATKFACLYTSITYAISGRYYDAMLIDLVLSRAVLLGLYRLTIL